MVPVFFFDLLYKLFYYIYVYIYMYMCAKLVYDSFFSFVSITLYGKYKNEKVLFIIAAIFFVTSKITYILLCY